MRKNGEYVGVDEKYIPDDEKYVNDSLNDEIKGFVTDGVKAARNYVSDKDNQEKIKKTGKKGLKILKHLSIGYLVFVGIIIVLFISIFVIAFSSFFRMSKTGVNNIDDSNSVINNIKDQINDNSSTLYDTTSFNSSLEVYKGSKLGISVLTLLENVVLKIESYSERSLIVIFNNRVYDNVEDIRSLMNEVDSTIKYDISFDYDSSGYITKVNISF